MKGILTVIVFLISIVASSQTERNPEDYVRILSKDGEKVERDFYKPDLSHNPDSVHPLVIDDVKRTYTLNTDSLSIAKHLIGEWRLKNSRRTNGKEGNMTGSKFYNFDSNGRFSFTRNNDTIVGNWLIPEPKKGRLKLKYDEPYFLLKGQSIAEHLDEATIKTMTYESEDLTLSLVDQNELAILKVNSVNHQDNDSFKRIVFLIYERK